MRNEMFWYLKSYQQFKDPVKTLLLQIHTNTTSCYELNSKPVALIL